MVVEAQRPKRKKHNKQTTETIALQKKALAMALRDDLPERLQLDAMKQYVLLGDWRRVLKGKPLPGSLKPEVSKSDRRVASDGQTARAHTAALVAAAKAGGHAQADVPANG